MDEEVLKKRAERFGDQLANNQILNINLDEKRKQFRKSKLNRALGNRNGNRNKRILSLANRNGNRISNRKRNFRNRRLRFGGRNKNSLNNNNQFPLRYRESRRGARRGLRLRLRGN
jgi:hypothetical protein